MKKLLSVLFLGICFCGYAFADEYRCPNTYIVNSGLSKFISNASGSNFLYTKLLEQTLEKQAKKQFSGHFDVKLKSFSKKDLKEGKFKSLSATGENIKVDGISIDKVTINSLCDFNQFTKNENSKYEFVTDFPADITFELTSANINQVKNLPGFKEKLEKINSQLNGFLSVKDANFDIKDGKLVYAIDYTLPFSPKEQRISVTSDIMFFDNTVYNQSEAADGKSAVMNFLKLTNALNYINPLDFSAKFLQNNNIATRIKNVYIRDDKVIVEALLNITK